MNKKTAAAFGIMVCIMFVPCIRAKADIQPTMGRISGGTRYDTAVRISSSGWTEGSCDSIVLTTGENYPDALCAVPLARLLHSPVLLTPKSHLNESVRAEIKRVGAKNVFIIGGVEVINESVEQNIRDMGIKCIRLSGNDRYETSAIVARYIKDNLNGGNEIAVTTGDDFPDALSISPVAAERGIPIILVPKYNMPDTIRKFLDGNYIKKTFIIGNADVIDSSMERQFPNPERICGTDKYGTNVEVMKRFSNDINFNIVYVSTGNDFPDALAGSALAAVTSSPIILVENDPPKVTMDFISSIISSISRMVALGGEDMVHFSTLGKLIYGDDDLESKYNDFSLRYDADFKEEVYDDVYWVPANVLGEPEFTGAQIAGLRREPETLQKSINTLYDLILYIRASDFKSIQDSIKIKDGEYTWEHYKPGMQAVTTNGGCSATMANLVCYLLKGDYDEVGILEYFEDDGCIQSFNYIRQDGKYYVFDLMKYINENENNTAVESGNMDDYYKYGSAAGNIHETDFLEDYTLYYRKTWTASAKLWVSYSSNEAVPVTWKSKKYIEFVCFPNYMKNAIQIVYNNRDDDLGYDFIEGPSKLPSWQFTYPQNGCY